MIGNTPTEKENLNRFFNEVINAQWLAAINPATESIVLEKMVNTAPPALLERIAEHPNASINIFRKLVTHPSADVRSAISNNSNAPQEIILALCIDENPDVRFSIAENHNTPITILQVLAEDDNPYVAARAGRTLNRISSPAIKHQLIELPNKVELPKCNLDAKNKLKVLVIEDNLADVKLLQKLLTNWPFELACVDRLSKGLECIAKDKVDIVLLDLTLPDAQGIDTFYKLHCQAPHIPIIVLTGLEDESVGNEAVQSGAQDYLVKGQVLPGLLGRSIKYAIERHRSEAQLKQLHESLERRVIQLATANEELDKLAKSLALTGERALQASNFKSQFEPGNVELNIVDFCPVTLIEDTAELFAASAAQKNLSVMTYIDAGLQPVLQGDPKHLQEILANLVNNAIKFTNQGELLIRATKESEDGEYVTARFSVIDTGIGMSDAVCKRLFDPSKQPLIFKQKDSGLGLSICKRLVELMGGQIGVESKQGKGSLFWFSVCLKKRPADSELCKQLGFHAPLNSYQQNARVLIVADNSITSDIIHRYVSAAGWRDGITANAEESINILHRAIMVNAPYNAVIVDLEASSPNSFDLAKTIQQDPILSATQLVFLTNTNQRHKGEQSWSAGFSAYLTKPIKQWNLLDCIAELTDNYGKQFSSLEPSQDAESFIIFGL